MLNAQTISAIALDTVGSNGLDTQSAATALSNTWFTKANNITYTEGGRVSFRKGANQRTISAGSFIGSMVEYKDATSTKLFVSYSGNIARLELTQKDDPFKDVYTPADVVTSDWHWTNFNNKLIGVQGNSIKPILFDGASWGYLQDSINATSSGTLITAGSFNIGTLYEISTVGTTDFTLIGASANTVGVIFTASGTGIGDGEAYEGATLPEGVSNFNPTCSLGYYGRLWVGGISEEKDVLHYSALLDESQWWTAAGLTDAGYIDLKTVWGKDEIVAVHSYAGKLVIFGKDNIVIYNDPAAVGVMALDEVIRGIGCVARDSIQAIGDDILFLSATGVRSLTRTAEFDKLPLKEISVTIKDELISNIKSGGSVKSVYMSDEGLYLLTFVNKAMSYVFDLTYTTERGTPRITKWDWSDDKHPSSLVYSEEYGLLLGQNTGNIATYAGYLDTDYDGTTHAYKGGISTVWIDLGQGTIASILKKLLVVISGGQGTEISLRTYKDFSMKPILNHSFKANPTLGGIPYKWSNAITQEDLDDAGMALADQVLSEIVGLEGDSVLSALLNESITVGGSSYIRGDTNNSGGALNITDAISLLRYNVKLTSPGDADYDWIQEHLIDHMLANLDIYGVYFNIVNDSLDSIYGCDTSYDYGGSGFCSTSTYSVSSPSNSLINFRDQASCEAANAAYVWNTVTDTADVNNQPVHCSSNPAKFAPIAGFVERAIHLAGTAKYLRIEMDGLTNGYESSLQSISLLYKQGKTL